MAAKITKFKRMVRSLIKDLVVIIILVGLCAGAFLSISSIQEEAAQEKARLESSVNNTQTQTRKITNQINNMTESGQIFQSLLRQRDNMNFAVDPNIIRDQLGLLKQRYQLASLKVELVPEEAFAPPELELVDEEATAINIEMNLGALSDQVLFDLVEDLGRSVPGFVQLSSIEMKRGRNIDIETLRRIRSGSVVAIVDGVMELTWYGYVPIAEAAPDNEKTAEAPEDQG